MYTADELEIRCALAGSPRAEQLIACLEGEIAKRDAELAACRVAVENCEVFRARIAELEARIVWLECEAQVNAAPVSEARAQGVLMPERWNVPRPMWKDARQPYGNPLNHADIEAAEKFNLALDEVVRLNAAPAAPAADAGHVIYGMDGNHQGNQHMTTQDLVEFYTLETLAARLNRSVVGVRTRLRASGRLPHGQYTHAKGSPLMFPVTEIEALIERDPGLVLASGKDSDQ